MDNKKGLTQEDVNNVLSHINSNELILRNKESDLTDQIIKMSRANRDWFEAKKKGDKEEMNIQLNKYNEAKKRAEMLLKKYKEQSSKDFN